MTEEKDNENAKISQRGFLSRFSNNYKRYKGEEARTLATTLISF